MPVTASMLWFVESDDPIADLRLGVVNDTEAADAVAHLVAGVTATDLAITARGDGTLDTSWTSRPGEVAVGVFGRITVVAGDLGDVQTPSRLSESLLAARPSTSIMLLHTDAQRSIGTFARWEGGVLRRSFSADPVDIVENLGLPYLFEKAFWAGDHPLMYADGVPHDPLALPFHPIEFADAASTTWIGFRLTPPHDPAGTPPGRIPVRRYNIHASGALPAPDDAPSRPASDDGTSDQPSGSKVARWFGFGRR